MAVCLPLLLVLVQGLEPNFLQTDARSEPSADHWAALADEVLADAGVSDGAATPAAPARPAAVAAAMKRAHAFVHSARAHSLGHAGLKAGPFNETHKTMTPSGHAEGVMDGTYERFVCPYNLDGSYSAEEDHPEYSVRCAELELLVNGVTAVEKKLNENVEAQRDARRRLRRMAHASKHGIAAEDPKIQDYEAKVTAETASRGLGEMIGGMWKEMRMFAAPSYAALLKERQAELSKEERALRRRLLLAQNAVDDLKSQYALEDAELLTHQEDAWRNRHVAHKAQPKASKAQKPAGDDEDDEGNEDDEDGPHAAQPKTAQAQKAAGDEDDAEDEMGRLYAESEGGKETRPAKEDKEDEKDEEDEEDEEDDAKRPAYIKRADKEDDYSDETHIHEVVPIWPEESSLPFSLEFGVALLWVLFVASTPFTLARITGKEQSAIDLGLTVALLVTLFGGLYLFTNIILFQSAHFKTQRPLTLVEAVYLMAQVITTVGYGDVTPAMPRGQVFVGLYVIVSFLVIAVMMSQLVAHLIALTKTRLDGEDPTTSGKKGPSTMPASARLQDPSTMADPAIAWLRPMPELSYRSLRFSFAVYLFFALTWALFFTLMPGEGKRWYEALYMSIITLSTVGFGAFTAATEAGKVFAAFWMIFGSLALVGLIGEFTKVMATRHQMEEVSGHCNLAALDSFQAKLGKDSMTEADFIEFFLTNRQKASQAHLDGYRGAFQTLAGRQRTASSAEIAELVESSDSYKALSHQARSKGLSRYH